MHRSWTISSSFPVDVHELDHTIFLPSQWTHPLPPGSFSSAFKTVCDSCFVKGHAPFFLVSASMAATDKFRAYQWRKAGVWGEAGRKCGSLFFVFLALVLSLAAAFGDWKWAGSFFWGCLKAKSGWATSSASRESHCPLEQKTEKTQTCLWLRLSRCWWERHKMTSWKLYEAIKLDMHMKLEVFPFFNLIMNPVLITSSFSNFYTFFFHEANFITTPFPFFSPSMFLQNQVNTG